jgi:DNA-binding MarR family transcriptional regulator
MSGTPTTSADVHAELAAEVRLALVPLVRQLRQQAGPDLTSTLVSALVTVAKEGPITLGDLAAREHVSQPMITKIAARMVERGLATKATDAADRRVSRLRITTAGQRALDRTRTRKNAWLAKRLRRLSEDELQIVRAVLPILERIAADR